MISKKFVIRDTKKYGKGIFATSNIKKGEVILEMKGKKVDVNEVWRYILSGKINLDDPLQIGRRTHLILEKTARLFNHSCDPNAGLRKNSQLFAIKDIKKDEEITMDYSLTASPTNDWMMKCKCGSKICRKLVGDILTVPRKRLEYYKNVGALQSYMRKLLPQLLRNRNAVPMYDTKAIAAYQEQ